MARKHYWQFLVTDEGNPIENAQISIYTAGTEDPVYVFTDEVGAGFASTAPQTVTSRKGYFEFWIADENEANGYPLSTKFKIAWSAAGVSDGYIDYIDVFSTSWAPVDETDPDPLKNKAVSNFLAKGWEDHKDAVLPFQTPHGLSFLVETDTDIDKNKVISNYQGFIWDYHTKRYIDPADGVIKSYSPIAVEQIIDMHGILQATEYTGSGTGYWGINGDVKLNRLVSNDLIYQSDSHINNTSRDDHTQYTRVNATRSFSADIHGVSTTAISTDTTLVTKDYVDNKSYTETVTATDWFIDIALITAPGTGYVNDTNLPCIGGSGTGLTVDITTYTGAVVTVTVNTNGTGYITGEELTINVYGTNCTFVLGDMEYDIIHNLDDRYPSVTLWDIDASPEEIVYPLEIKTIDVNGTKIKVSTNIDHFVRLSI